VLDVLVAEILLQRALSWPSLASLKPRMNIASFLVYRANRLPMYPAQLVVLAVLALLLGLLLLWLALWFWA
jgi:hypothetical protein